MKEYMKKKVLLFDLDGTLTDSAEGVFRCVAHALAAFGISAEPQSLCGYIGPPLNWSFPHFHGLTEEETDRAIGLFRREYEAGGKFENRVYEGVFEMLSVLRAAGYLIGVATSKPLHFATQILDHFGLTAYFDYIAGTGDDERGGKEEVVRDAVAHFGVNVSEMYMIGDRQHDIIGGHAVGLEAIGVLWGYGSREEFETYGADIIVETPAELVAFLTEACTQNS